MVIRSRPRTTLSALVSLVATVATGFAATAALAGTTYHHGSLSFKRRHRPLRRGSDPAATMRTQMLSAINAARAQRGLPAVRLSPVLSGSAGSYAHAMIALDRWAHAQSFQHGTGFREVGEILARCPDASPDIRATLAAWLASPEHRPILLGSQYGYAGIGFARGRMGSQTAAVWVVRFGSR